MSSVLVVEDDPNLRTVIGMVLEQRGHKVSEAVNGADALDQLATDLPEVVVADMKMPIVNGSELIRRMRGSERLRSIPVVIVTGTSDVKNREPLADAVLLKPFEPVDLWKEIDRLTSANSIR